MSYSWIFINHPANPGASPDRIKRPALVSPPAPLVMFRGSANRLTAFRFAAPAALRSACAKAGSHRLPTAKPFRPRLVSPPAPQPFGFRVPAPRAAPCLVPPSASPDGLAPVLREPVAPRQSPFACFGATCGVSSRPSEPCRLARTAPRSAAFSSGIPFVIPAPACAGTGSGDNPPPLGVALYVIPAKAGIRAHRFAFFCHSRNAVSPSMFKVDERCHSDGTAQRRRGISVQAGQ